MTIAVSYMGTKRKIAPVIADVASLSKKGPFLDLFSGVCAVGAAMGTDRSIWCNDTQVFAATVARAFFQSKKFCPCSAEAADKAFDFYQQNAKKLADRFERHIGRENKLLLSAKTREIGDFYRRLPYVGLDQDLLGESKRLRKKPTTFPYRLFTITFAGGYVGLKQAIEIDSIRYAIDMLRNKGAIDRDSYRWWILALCQALCKVSTTTGHFAQYLKIKDNNHRKFVNQRRKSVWLHWIEAIDELVPKGWTDWRRGNRVFNEDAVGLLKKMSRRKVKPAVVYADPPYTDDQYSRYYHLYETVILYDYPLATGMGRYRQERFQSSFCHASKVVDVFSDLIDAVSALGSDFIVSYPEFGLLPNAKEDLPRMLRKRFRNIEIAHELDAEHSSLGASKGHERYYAKELVIIARRACG